MPVYIQLKEGLKLLILTGVYVQGAKLPTVRQMAVDLRVNSNTVARSYSELEREGIISTQQGRGTFVCAIPTGVENDEKEKELDKILEEFIKTTLSLGFTEAYIIERLTNKIKDRK
ncbi:GntR family transcriptional regulator [Anaerosinus massiliensis]|uniref:GntR family transcriptional regulator n=1 Tax=Massilibacillus massiliensis TaxID=1806837 RepID=UPI0018FE4CFB|nr:GntR family transcriptional regulator [Massilibacillus massiliensis]